MKTHKNIKELLESYELEKLQMYNSGSKEVDEDDLQFIDWFSKNNKIT